MKRLVLALILALVLTVVFSTTVLADDGKGPDNMPDDTAQHLLDHVAGNGGWWNQDGKLFNGLRSCYGKGSVGIGVVYSAYPNIISITNGETPGPPSWANNP